MKLVIAYLLFSFCFQAELLDMKQVKQCTRVALRNGKAKYRQRGRFVKFLCNPGFWLVGDKYANCLMGEWDSSPPQCIKPGCKKPIIPSNILVYDSYAEARYQFFCKSAGNVMRGKNVISCDGKNWDSGLPTCSPSGIKPQLFCDFEDEHICGWTHDVNHDFEWRRLNFDTPSGSIGTGPSHDHTKGAKRDGYYMYIESSSRNENDTARLVSPVFDKNERICIEFFYHMYGATTGTLRAYLKTVSEPWLFPPNKAFFSKSGNQGNFWFRHFHEIGNVTEDFQVIFEGIRGKGYVSDIAIDDVRIIDDCNGDDFVETTQDGSTTDSSTTELLTVESCESRCGMREYNRQLHFLTCDCDAFCFERNRCCPDYIRECILAFTDTSEAFTEEQLTTKAETRWIEVKTDEVQVEKKIIPTEMSTKVTSRGTTKKVVKLTPVTRKLIILTPLPTTVLPIVKYTKTTPALKVTVKPKLKSPSTPVPTTWKPNLNKFKLKKPNRTFVNMDDLDNDAVTISYKENDVLYYWSTRTPSKGIKAFEPKPDPVETEFSQRINLPVAESTETVGSNIMIIAVSCTVLLIVILIILVVVFDRVKKWRLNMNSSIGDSQSDVRFLTSDEVLDFTLARDYDDF